MAFVVPASLVAAFCLFAVAASPAQATGSGGRNGGQTVTTQFPLSDYPLTDFCNTKFVIM